MPRESRKSYPASLKLDAIDYAKTTNNCVAAKCSVLIIRKLVDGE